MEDLKTLCEKAVAAKYEVALLSSDVKNDILNSAADLLIRDTNIILQANAKDMAAGREKGLSEGLLDRLLLTEDRISQIANGIRVVAGLDDPIGEIISMKKRPNGLLIGQKKVPMGVIGVIYEARPNVTADVFSLCLKTGNACILKGGSDAFYSNKAIVETLKEALKDNYVNTDAVSLIEDNSRETTKEFMQMKEYVDLLIPRGGAGLIRSVVDNAKIPVIETGTGNCHIYVDESADQDMALSIIKNAKTQRIGVCNAAESLLVHENIAKEFLPKLQKTLSEPAVELRTDEEARSILPDTVPATEEDWGTEYLDYIMSVKIVKNLDEAISHINKYNTGHSECIVTDNISNSERFLAEVDSACVYVNASTRFTDGFEFGLGAEIGISTQKLHARGPMGLSALTSTKYIILGQGQIR